MNGVRLVPMRAEHLEAAAGLEAICFSMPWSREMLAHELENQMASYIVAEDEGGGLLGYAGLHAVLGEGYITNVAVRPDARRCGIARLLLSAFLRFGRANLAFLTLEVRAGNAAAIALYEGLGFVEVGRRRGYYEQPREDAVIMTVEFTS